MGTKRWQPPPSPSSTLREARTAREKKGEDEARSRFFYWGYLDNKSATSATNMPPGTCPLSEHRITSHLRELGQ
jgi:hypothetical protein